MWHESHKRKGQTILHLNKDHVWLARYSIRYDKRVDNISYPMFGW